MLVQNLRLLNGCFPLYIALNCCGTTITGCGCGKGLAPKGALIEVGEKGCAATTLTYGGWGDEAGFWTQTTLKSSLKMPSLD